MKKILWTSLGFFIGTGTSAGVLVPLFVINKNNDKNDQKNTNNQQNQKITNHLVEKIKKTNSENDLLAIILEIYKLEKKKKEEIFKLQDSILKTRYLSAAILTKYIHINKNNIDILIKTGKEKVTNLEQLLLIIIPKNKNHITSASFKWPLNEVDQKNDQVAILITFSKNKVIKVESKLIFSYLNNTNLFFTLKEYDMIHLFYKFKNANPQAADFGYYNNYLDDRKNAQGLIIFKNYLLNLMTDNSKIKNSDLKDLQFIKKSHNSKTNKTTADLRFSYQGLSTTKTISDFLYKKVYNLSFKPEARNKIADDVISTDIITTNLPTGITIARVEVSPEISDGTTVKITFAGKNDDVSSQKLSGLLSYEDKAINIVNESIDVLNGLAINKKNKLASEYQNREIFINKLKQMTSTINEPARSKVKDVFENAKIIYRPKDASGQLRLFILTKDTKKVSSALLITGFDLPNSVYQINKRIDAEIARKTKPIVKNNSKWKSSEKLKIEDITIIPHYATLKSKVTAVNLISGTKLISVNIEVSSSIEGTKTETYNVNIETSISTEFDNIIQFLLSYFSNNESNVLSKTPESSFLIPNKEKKLPSSFKDTNLIKEFLKNKFITLFWHEENKKIKAVIEAIDNIKITFFYNDQKGILIIVLKNTNYTEATNWVYGFKTST